MECPSAEPGKAVAETFGGEEEGDLAQKYQSSHAPDSRQGPPAHTVVCALEMASLPLVDTAPCWGHSLTRGTLALPARSPGAVNNLYNHMKRLCLTGPAYQKDPCRRFGARWILGTEQTELRAIIVHVPRSCLIGNFILAQQL